MKGIFVELIKPDLNLTAEFNQFYHECLETDGMVHGDGGFSNFTTFSDWLNHLKLMESETSVPSGYVPAFTYLLYNYIHEEIMGIVNIRTRLNDNLLKRGGNIGYSIRPKYRHKGNGKMMLRMALDKCRALALSKVLITCDKTNLASQQLIKSCRGVEDSYEIDYQRFWIAL